MRQSRLVVIVVLSIGLLTLAAGTQRLAGQRRPSTDAAPPSLNRPPVAKDDAEKRILAVLDDLDRNQRRGNMNVPTADGRLLRMLVEATNAKRVVEIGTSNGFSGIWICLGLRKTGGKLITHDIDEGRAALARKNFKRAGVEDLVTLVMGDAHETIKKLKGPIDIVFIDADKPGYPDYLEKVLPLVRPGGLILGHNMRRPKPDPRFVDAVRTDPALETLFVHMNESGMSISLKKR